MNKRLSFLLGVIAGLLMFVGIYIAMNDYLANWPKVTLVITTSDDNYDVEVVTDETIAATIDREYPDLWPWQEGVSGTFKTDYVLDNNQIVHAEYQVSYTEPRVTTVKSFYAKPDWFRIVQGLGRWITRTYSASTQKPAGLDHRVIIHLFNNGAAWQYVIEAQGVANVINMDQQRPLIANDQSGVLPEGGTERANLMVVFTDGYSKHLFFGWDSETPGMFDLPDYEIDATGLVTPALAANTKSLAKPDPNLIFITNALVDFYTDHIEPAFINMMVLEDMRIENHRYELETQRLAVQSGQATSESNTLSDFWYVVNHFVDRLFDHAMFNIDYEQLRINQFSPWAQAQSVQDMFLDGAPFGAIAFGIFVLGLKLQLMGALLGVLVLFVRFLARSAAKGVWTF